MTGNRCTNGSLTTFVYGSYFLYDASPIRALIYDGNYLNTTSAGTNVCLTISATNPVCWLTDPAPAGNPGIGGYAMPAGNGFTAVKIGHHDTVAPGTVNVQSVATSVSPTQASIRWQGVADDHNGIGVLGYVLVRSGGPQTCYPGGYCLLYGKW